MFKFGRKKSTKTEPVPGGNALLGRLLLVVDGSDASVAAAEFAVELAAGIGSEITAIYVVDTATMDYLMQMRILVKEEREEFEGDLERTGSRYLDYVTTLGRNLGLEVETVQRKGRFHQTILKEARTMRADAIVVGGWRRTVTRKDATSVERQLILDQAECPVIVVKGEDTQRRTG